MKRYLRQNQSELFMSYERIKQPRSSIMYSSHIHNCYELLYFYDGDVDFIINGAIYHLQKHDMMLVKPAIYHHIRVLSSRPYERFVIHFYESVVRKDLLPVLRNMETFYRIEPSEPIRKIFDYARDCAGTFDKNEYLYLAEGCLNNILTNVKYLQKPAPKEKEDVDSHLEKILLYIDEHPTLPLNIAHLSQLFNLSESWIAHAFKKHLGVSPAHYINRKKIVYAQSLIDMGMSPVQAAEACSYINYTTFYRQYKKYLGVGPSERRKLTLEQE